MRPFPEEGGTGIRPDDLFQLVVARGFCPPKVETRENRRAGGGFAGAKQPSERRKIGQFLEREVALAPRCNVGYALDPSGHRKRSARQKRPPFPHRAVHAIAS